MNVEKKKARAHEWARQNRVTFDPGKESFHIIHPLCDEPSEFRMLGTLIDSSLTMTPLIDKLLVKVRPKVRALSRVQFLYSRETLLNQFKTHSHMGAYRIQ